MSVAGYVLAGGNSTRMGRDKALLETGGVALARRVARIVEAAAGSVTLIGDPGKYGLLGIAVIPDLRPGHGPAGGVEAALLDSGAEWNLIAACDLAALRSDFLGELRDRAFDLPDDVDCLIPADPDGRMHPLSAIYRRRCAGVFSDALDRGERKMTNIVKSLKFRVWTMTDTQLFQNVNTPDDWNRYLNGRTN
jgi:molybdopterin-guanine dinucleotide biosynthesis protein A